MDYHIALRRARYEMLAIETDRLRLAVLRKSEASRVAGYFIKNREFHRRFSQTHPDSYFTVSEQRSFLAYDCSSFLDGSVVPLWITLKGRDEIIGRVSFFNLAYGGMMNCAVGYHLDQEYTGAGYMTEALEAACSFMFKEYKMHRIEAFILPENEASIRLIKRAGFVSEGRRVSYMHINGEYRDHDAFYLLEPDYRNNCGN